MNPRDSVLRALRWDLAALAIMGLVAFGYSALQSPTTRPAEDTTRDGGRPPDRPEGDILLLVPDSPAAEALVFDELDCTYAWFNALWQEHGSFATTLTRSLSPEVLAGRSLVIVPRRVAEAMPSTGIAALADFVRRGGQVMLERPTGEWSSLSGFRPTDARPRRAQTISSAEGIDAHGPMRRHLPKVPLSGSLIPAPSAPAYPQGPVLIEVDGQPGVVSHELGEGRVISTLFDVGCSLVGMQQGRPDDGMSWVRRGPDAEDPLMPTSGRVVDPRMLENKVPYADLLERAILGIPSRRRPLPKLWMYPGTSAGALVLTHSTPDNMRAALGLSDWSRRSGGASTIFVASDRADAAQVALARETGADLGLLWMRGVARPAPSRSIGVGALRPFAQQLSLVEQRDALDALLGPGGRAARAERARFDNHFSLTFEKMNAARVVLDHSLGPSGPEESGYLFGTGFPFYPIDERGLPLPLVELPFLLHEGSLTRDLLEDYLGNSAAYFHQVVAVSLPAHTMRTSPSAGALLALKDAHELAKEDRHWVATVRELLDFLSARRRSVLTSRWSPIERRLTISLNLVGVKSASLPQGATPGLAIPRVWRGQEIERVLIGERDVPLASLVTTGPSTDQLLSLPPGRHTVSVFYANPEAIPEPKGEVAPRKKD
jgi:hypothetical protein